MTEPPCCVLACGYRYFHSAKSGLRFPAWLLCLPSGKPVWRTKRDFLLLSRSVAYSCCFPRAALTKLAAKAPWMRPDYQGTRDELVDCGCDEEKKNRFEPCMKKSLWQLDRFLQTIHREAARDGCCSSNSKMSEAWKLFCHSADTPNLVKLPEVAAAETNSEEHASPPPTTTTSIQESARLGQYFCSPENAQQLADLALQQISAPLCDQKEEVVLFVEPSCGDGQVLEALLEHCLKNTLLPNCRILGYDIDPNAVEACRQRLSRRQPSPDVHLECRDFLTLTRPDLLKHAAAERNKGLSVTVIFVGGPPYTSGAGSGAAMERDLPTRFLRHCLETLCAHAVVFLLPERYRTKPITHLLLSGGWKCQTIALESSSTFHFRGTTPVMQPSIVQCWTDGTNGFEEHAQQTPQSM